VIHPQAAHGFGAVGNHARQIDPLGLPPAECLTFHGVGWNRATPRQHGGMKFLRDFRQVGADQIALVVGQGRAGGSHRLVFANGEHFHLDPFGIERG